MNPAALAPVDREAQLANQRIMQSIEENTGCGRKSFHGLIEGRSPARRGRRVQAEHRNRNRLGQPGIGASRPAKGRRNSVTLSKLIIALRARKSYRFFRTGPFFGGTSGRIYNQSGCVQPRSGQLFQGSSPFVWPRIHPEQSRNQKSKIFCHGWNTDETRMNAKPQPTPPN